jgi:hypothetical protein
MIYFDQVKSLIEENYKEDVGNVHCYPSGLSLLVTIDRKEMALSL